MSVPSCSLACRRKQLPRSFGYLHAQKPNACWNLSLVLSPSLNLATSTDHTTSVCARVHTRPGRPASTHPLAFQLADGDPAFAQLAGPQQHPSTPLCCRLGHIRPAGLLKALWGPALHGRGCSGSWLARSCRGSGPGVAGSGAWGNPGGAGGAEGGVGGSKVGPPLACPGVCRQTGCRQGIGPCRGSCGV